MTDYEKLKALYNEIDTLIEQRVSSDDAKFKVWHSKVKKLLPKMYGEGSVEYDDFLKTRFSLSVWGYSTTEEKFIEACIRGLNQTKEFFKSYLEDIENGEYVALKTDNKIESLDCSKVFIVHGHDGELKQSVARLIEQQGIEAIILSEQANQGRTIIEKFEDYSDVGGAICLFTADDYGRAKVATDDNKRARQNVVFEAGYFIGKLGRNHVVLIADRDVEMPSDLSGVVYTEKGNWQFELIKELRAIGYDVDANKLI